MAFGSVFQLLSVMALGTSSVMAADSTGSLTMAVGTNGTTVQAVSGTTVFMGTEYNPAKCVLQFLSLECDDTNCAELNGFELECVTQGKQNGKDKKMCECKAEDANSCQNSANPNATSGTVAQFGECSDTQQCVDSYGYITTSTEEGPICAEKLHCLEEVNTTATEPASICHTCMSCIAQNDAADKQLAGVKRFNCSSICPQEILDTVAERNAAGVGIADSYSLTASTSGSDANSSESQTSGSSSSAAGSSSAASVAQHSSLAVILSGLIAMALIAMNVMKKMTVC
ncbi:hypothetical protein BBO99_00005642 [Phytophthora kernoviae]|uniref:Uncharacterized protein n=2 Tax=Phytophthora kernoviae TaxID=325452 RepID=A0A3R7GQM9_9STRA|nr:hypothetical protein G195_009393 [Phytophthora kernoviae 00238/432]RLN31406.1 hypothetical protein BBI17_005676 [Phytophthora kernoviae]RLN78898.1 hypothetical protein BBO99_00005642 [Phytophthora kernoviae]